MIYRDNIIAALVVFLIIGGAAVGARIYVRTKVLTRGFGWDDTALIITFLGYIMVCAMSFTSMAYGYAAEDKKPYYNASKAERYYFATQLSCYISSGLVKLAVALVLIRLANTKGLRWTLYISMVIVTLWTTIMTIFTSWLCASGGTSNYAGTKTCGTVGYFRTISNIFIDYFYALLPIYILWNVQISIKLKVTALFLLGLGIFASSATIVKLVIIIRLQTATGKEADGLHYDLLLWAIIELGLAICAASAAALRPLLQYIPVIWDSLYGRSHSRSYASEAVGPYSEFGEGHEMDRHMSKPSNLERVTSGPSPPKAAAGRWTDIHC